MDYGICHSVFSLQIFVIKLFRTIAVCSKYGNAYKLRP